MARYYRKHKPAPPAVLDMAKVIAAAAKPCREAEKPGINMAKVVTAASSRHTSPTRPAPSARVTLPPEDAGRRRPIINLHSGCVGFSHFHSDS